MTTNNYVCYRLPEQKEYVRLEQREGEPVAMKSVKDLNGRKGFVFAPFQPSEETPVWLLQPDSIERKAVGEDGKIIVCVSTSARRCSSLERLANWS